MLAPLFVPSDIGSASVPPTWPATQPTLDADGLTLRPWRASDADAVFAACQDPEIVRWTSVPFPYEHKHAESYVGPVSADTWHHKTAANFAVTDAAGTLVGSFGLVRMAPLQSVAEVGYRVAPAARRQGVAVRPPWPSPSGPCATSASRASSSLAAVGNAGSRRVAERLGGIIQEGVLRSAAPARGHTRVDLVMYSRLATGLTLVART